LNKVAEKILEELRNQGPIPFARFMKLALYCPVYGYYEKEGDTIGRRGDYHTSVSVGPLFGELLGAQFSEWLSALPMPVCLVEAGAHQGLLALDLLRWIRANRPELFAGLTYWVVEPSLKRREWQTRTLQEFAGRILWARESAEVLASNQQGIRGIVFCNELLDAMPTRRFGWDAATGEWFEWGVTFENGQFVWTRLALEANSTPVGAIPHELPLEILKVLPDAFTFEISPAAVQWWTEAARVLAQGKLVAFDYGLAAEERPDPARPQGTLRAYRHHRLAPNPLADPGEQDLTAHVDFESIQRAGELAGLRTEQFMTQERFLMAITSKLMCEDPSRWSGERVRQLQTLTHPEHFGHSFRVLVQGR